MRLDVHVGKMEAEGRVAKSRDERDMRLSDSKD